MIRIAVYKLYTLPNGELDPYLEHQTMMDAVYQNQEDAMSYILNLCKDRTTLVHIEQVGQ